MSVILPVPPLAGSMSTNFGSTKRGRVHAAWLPVFLCAVALCLMMPAAELAAQPSPPKGPSDAVAEPPAGARDPAPDDSTIDAAKGADANSTAAGTEATAEGAPDQSKNAPAKEQAAQPAPSEEAVEEAAETKDAAATEPERAGSETPPPAAAAQAPASEPEPAKLKVAIWSGAYGAAQQEVVIKRFKTKRDIDVEVIIRSKGAPIDLDGGDRDVSLDAVEFSAAEVETGCSAGQLLEIATGERAHDVTGSDAARADFMPGSLKPCGIGAFAWSHVMAIDRAAFKKDKPQTLADIFDVKRFPGKRALIKDPRFLLEAALMADGAMPGEVYGLLATAEGQNRALAKLAQIGKEIIWVDSSKAAIQALASGDAAVAQTFSGRAFFAVARGLPLDIIWDGQIYSMTYWAIPAKSTRQELAREFLRFATEPQQLAAIAQRFPYGPTRTSALALTKRHLTAGLDLDAFLPTAPENLSTALAHDEGWWRDNREMIDARFAAWLTELNAAKTNEPKDAEAVVPPKKKGRR
jgi:putative spermidine/putrescine transport system substrate-binding protein